MNIIGWAEGAITAANTAKDGTGVANWIYGPADEDTYVDRVVFRALGSNVATCVRVFINRGGGNADAGNNILYAEKTLAVTTLDEAAAFADNEITLGLWLPAGYQLFVLLGTAVAAGYHATAVAGDY